MRVRFRRVVTAALAAGALVAGLQAPAHGAPVPPAVTKNPTPGTDAFAIAISPLTGGTRRVCAHSKLGLTIYCHEQVPRLPSASATASGVTFAHHIFCRGACVGGLLTHELVHVGQFERHGDSFGPLYLAEAARHGTGCENKYERPAYQANGQCLS
jgi:hypothetical protein